MEHEHNKTSVFQKILFSALVVMASLFGFALILLLMLWAAQEPL